MTREQIIALAKQCGITERECLQRGWQVEAFFHAAQKLCASQAQQATPEGFVRVPLVMTRAMEEVTQQEDWQWADLLAAAEAVTEEQYGASQAQQTTVEQAVNRFLGWNLPQNFCPDAFISFDSLNALNYNCWPIGTNLLTADQAKAMFEYCLGAPK